MEVVFVGAWFVGLAGWFCGNRYFLPMWAAGFREQDRHKGYWRKSLIGFGIFILAVTVGFAAGGVAQYWGGGWH